MKRTPSSSPVLLLLLALMGLCLSSRDARGVLVCRIGKPFSAAERDSLERAGIDMREIGWSFYEQQDGFEPDSLTVGVMQPNYLEEDENTSGLSLLLTPPRAATSLSKPTLKSARQE